MQQPPGKPPDRGFGGTQLIPQFPDASGGAQPWQGQPGAPAQPAQPAPQGPAPQPYPQQYGQPQQYAQQPQQYAQQPQQYAQQPQQYAQPQHAAGAYAAQVAVAGAGFAAGQWAHQAPTGQRVHHDPIAIQQFALAALNTPAPAQSSAPLRTSVVLQREASIIELLNECNRLQNADKEAEKKKKGTYATWMWVCGIAAIFTVWIFGLGLLFLIPLGVLWYLRSQVAADDLEDRKLETISGTLATLGPELKPGRPVRVAADFSYHDQQTPLAQEHNSGGLFGYSSGMRAFVHWWLSLRFALTDGSTVTVDVKSFAKVKSRQKRKYTKVKERVVERIIVRIGAPKGKDFSPQMQQQGWGRQQFSGLYLKRGMVRPRQAIFEYQTSAGTRTSGRGAWYAQSLENLVDSRKVVAAVIASYKATARAAHGVR